MATTMNRYHSTQAAAHTLTIRWPDLHRGLVEVSDWWLRWLEEATLARVALSNRKWKSLCQFLSQGDCRPSDLYRRDSVRLQDYVYNFQELLFAPMRLALFDNEEGQSTEGEESGDGGLLSDQEAAGRGDDASPQ